MTTAQDQITTAMKRNMVSKLSFVLKSQRDCFKELTIEMERKNAVKGVDALRRIRIKRRKMEIRRIIGIRRRKMGIRRRMGIRRIGIKEIEIRKKEITRKNARRVPNVERRTTTIKEKNGKKELM